MEGFSRPPRNQILAVKRLSWPFPVPEGFRQVTVRPESAASKVLEVYAAPETTLRVYSDARADMHVYLWGLAGHSRLERSEIPRWIAGQITLGETSALRQIVGVYIALIDDRRTGAISIVTDVAGARPFFAGFRNGEIVCGSDVWTMARLGWISRRLNYDAIAAWIRAGYDFTEGSLFSDLSLIEPGAVTTFKENRTCVKPYVDFRGGFHRPLRDDLLEHIQDIMTRSFRSAARELPSIQLAMSGGYDSRYLAALAISDGLDLRSTCLSDKVVEATLAGEVARRLEMPLKIVQTDGSRWNAYDEPFHFAPSGFPITKQQSFLAAVQNPAMPCLNGFLGDCLIRGTVDRLEEKLPSETTEDHARVFQRAQNLMPFDVRFDLLDPDMLDRCDERTLPSCRRHIVRYAHTVDYHHWTM